MTGAIAALVGSGGSSDAVVNFADVYAYATNTGAGATAGYRINDDGFDYKGVNGTFTSNQQWLTPTSQGGLYEVIYSVTSGITPAGPTGWVATSTDPTWTLTRATVGVNLSELLFQVRRVGTTTVLDTWTVTLEAERV